MKTTTDSEMRQELTSRTADTVGNRIPCRNAHDNDQTV